MASLPVYFGADDRTFAKYVGSFEIAIKGNEAPILVKKTNSSYVKH